MTTALIALPIGIDPAFDLAVANEGAQSILAAAGIETVEVLVPVYASEPDIAKAVFDTLASVDLLVLTPSSTATKLGSALEKTAPLFGVTVRNLRKIAAEIDENSDGSDDLGQFEGRVSDPEITAALVATGHVVSEDGDVTTAQRARISLSDAQAG